MTPVSRSLLPIISFVCLTVSVLLSQSHRLQQAAGSHDLIRPSTHSSGLNTLTKPPADVDQVTAPARTRPSSPAARRSLTLGERMKKQATLVMELRSTGKTRSEIRSLVSSVPVQVGTGSISGTAYESDGTTVIPYLYLALYSEYGEWIDGESTDGTGRYQFEGLTTGNYYIQVLEDDYVNVYYVDAVDPINATLVAVVDGQETTGVDFILNRRPLITGHVFQEDGVTPIVNQRGQLDWVPVGLSYGFAATEHWYWYERVQVGEDGSYLLGIDPMEIRLSLNVAGYVGEYYQNAAQINSAHLLTITSETDTLKDIDFSLPLLVSNDDGYEPNNIWQQAFSIGYGDTVHAAIDPAWDADVFTFQGSVGDTVSLVVEADVIGSDLDSYLYLLDSTGIGILEVNDDFSLGAVWSADSRMEEVVLPYTGTYFVRLMNYFDSGGPDHFYNLILDQGAIPVPDDPYEPNDWQAEAHEISYGDTVHALIMPEDDTDVYRFAGQAGDTVTVKILAVTIGSSLEAFITLRDSNYNELTSIYYYYSYLDPWITNYVLPNTGTYYIEVETWSWEGGWHHFYSLILSKETTPTGAIAGTVTDSEGRPLPVPVALTLYHENTYWPVATDTIQLADSGRYVITGLLPADYTLLAEPQNNDTTNYASYYYDYQTEYYRADLITVIPLDTVKDIDFVTETESYIRGVVTFPAGYVYHDFHLPWFVLYNVDHPEQDVITQEITFVSGFEFGPLLPGRYKLAIMDLYSSLPAVYYGGGYSYDDDNTLTITLEPGDVVDASAALTPGPGSFSGTVYVAADSVLTEYVGYVIAYDGSGHPVQMNRNNRHPVTGSALDTGTYLLEGLMEGSYYLRFMVRTDSLGGEYYLSLWYPSVPSEPQSVFVSDFYATSFPEGALPLELTLQAPELSGVDFYFDGSAVGTGDRGTHGLPRAIALRQNYPNPFNPSTTLEFDLPAPVNLRIAVYDLTGRQVARLADGHWVAGYHQLVWLGRDDRGRELPSGIYITRLSTPNGMKSIKMLLLK